MKVEPSTRKGKKYVAIFDNGKKVHFGLKGSSTYLNHKNKETRKNYRARHDVNEKKFYNNPYKPATLSRFILWGEATNLRDAIKDYEKKFNV